MTQKHPIQLNFVCSFCAFWILTLAALPLNAQETVKAQLRTAETAQTSEAVKVKKPKRLARTAVVTELDDTAQLRAAIKQCGRACKMGGSGKIAAPGGTLDYNCDDDGNCSCFGAKDCVAMSDVCAEGTMGCNKQGCICEEG